MITRTNADFELNWHFLFANFGVDNGNTVERHKEEVMALSSCHELEKKDVCKKPNVIDSKVSPCSGPISAHDWTALLTRIGFCSNTY